MKVTMIIGEPCVGKSLLVKELMKLGKPWEVANPKYIPYHHSRSMGLTIVGNYQDLTHKYPGTDRMSMACQPHFMKWIIKARDAGVKSVLFEGDRLGNLSLIRALKMDGIDLEVIHLWLRPVYLAKRRAEQRPDQSEKFWASRRTKLYNIVSATPVKSFEHVTLADTHNIIAHIRKHRL